MAAGHDQSQAHLGAHPCAGSRQKLIWATLLILVGGTMFQLRATTFLSPRASASVRERTDNSPSASLLRPQQLIDSPPPQLPPGWASATDPSNKRRYYYHAARKTVQWSPPNAAATPTDGPPGSPTTAGLPTATNTNTDSPPMIGVTPPRPPAAPTDPSVSPAVARVAPAAPAAPATPAALQVASAGKALGHAFVLKDHPAVPMSASATSESFLGTDKMAAGQGQQPNCNSPWDRNCN